MIEPEIAFADLTDNMDLAEDLVKAMTTHVVENCRDDLELFAKFVDKQLMASLETIVAEPYVRLPYADAVRILKSSGRTFEFPVDFGVDLQTEHERFLCEEHFKKPVIVYDYPREIKAFYMRPERRRPNCGRHGPAVPRVGELVGGSQREERHDVLERRILDNGMQLDSYWWYLDLRRFGSVPHAGFGLGFERFLMMLTGVTNIRDVIPFPRTPKHLEF
jgi:asparaginyl-tRNA synthetase